MANHSENRGRGPEPGAENAGRPRIDFDWDLFDELCRIHCTKIELERVMGCSYDVMNRRIKEKFNMTFRQYYNTMAADGKASLRRKQWQKALEDENVTMMIHLGKVHLGQGDKAAPEGDDFGRYAEPEFSNAEDEDAKEEKEEEKNI